MATTLKEKAVKGVSWTLIDRFGRQGVKFVLGILLARLLTPKDFGLIGMVTVLFVIAQVFIESGFGQAYVQKKEVNSVDANTVFFINFTISFFLYGILWFTAPAIAIFYNEPSLIELIRVMSLVIFINAFNVIQIAQLTRDVDFKRLTKINLIATIISGIIGVIAAYFGLGVWSLVIQSISNRSFSTGGLWITSRWKPSLKFSHKSLKDMFSFGAWILFASLLRRIFDNIYILTIGRFFPTAQLGFYTKSVQFQVLASEQLSKAVGVVAFPLFSGLQNDKEKLRNGIRKFSQHTYLLIIPLLVTLMVVAKPFVILLLTEKWAPMIPYLQLLCLLGILHPIRFLNIQVLNALGKSKLIFELEMVRNSLRLINIAIMYRWGVAFIIIGDILLSLIMIFFNVYFTYKLIDYGFIKQIKDIKNILLGALLAGIFGYVTIIGLTNLWYLLFFGSFVTLSSYLGTQYLFNKRIFQEMIELSDIFTKGFKRNLIRH